MSAYKIQTPGNYPKESIQHTEHGESLKSRIIAVTNKHTAKLHHVGSLYILTYDARKPKHKIYGNLKSVRHVQSKLVETALEGETVT